MAKKPPSPLGLNPVRPGDILRLRPTEAYPKERYLFLGSVRYNGYATIAQCVFGHLPSPEEIIKCCPNFTGYYWYNRETGNNGRPGEDLYCTPNFLRAGLADVSEQHVINSTVIHQDGTEEPYLSQNSWKGRQLQLPNNPTKTFVVAACGERSKDCYPIVLLNTRTFDSWAGIGTCKDLDKITPDELQTILGDVPFKDVTFL